VGVPLCYASTAVSWENRFYFGDNLNILPEYVPDASADLIYLEPPFNCSATHSVPSVAAIYDRRQAAQGTTANAVRRYRNGEESAAQIMVFEARAVAPIYDRRLSPEESAVIDRRYSKDAEAVCREIVQSGPRKLADLIQALLAFLSRNDMMAIRPAPGARTVSEGCARNEPGTHPKPAGRSAVDMVHSAACAPPHAVRPPMAIRLSSEFPDENDLTFLTPRLDNGMVQMADEGAIKKSVEESLGGQAP
jgi:hypothetical protein